MKIFQFICYLFLIVFVLVLAGCGDNSASTQSDVIDPDLGKSFRLVAAEEIYYENQLKNKFVEITYDENNDKLFKEIDNSLIQYRYSVKKSISDFGLKSSSDLDADIICDLIFEQDKIIEKRFHSIKDIKSTGFDYSIIFFFDGDNNIIKEQHVDSFNDVNVEIDYKYAYKDVNKREFILIEKHYLAESVDIREYYRYLPGNENPVSIEYDINNDYNIDYIIELKYDSYGNRILSEKSEYLYRGGKKSISSTTYFWEEGVGNKRELAEIWDDGKASFAAGFIF